MVLTPRTRVDYAGKSFRCWRCNRRHRLYVPEGAEDDENPGGVWYYDCPDQASPLLGVHNGILMPGITLDD